MSLVLLFGRGLSFESRIGNFLVLYVLLLRVSATPLANSGTPKRQIVKDNQMILAPRAASGAIGLAWAWSRRAFASSDAFLLISG